jgi:hypothetical protein
VTKEELKNAVEQMVDEALTTKTETEESSSEVVEKAQAKGTKSEERPKEYEAANSGAPGKPEDKIKSGTPKMQEKKELTVKKAEEEPTSKEDVVEKASHEKKEDLKKKCIKKSENEEEVLEIDYEELELIKAWRAQKDEDTTKTENVSKAVEATEDLAKSFKEENENLKKSISDQAELIKSLTEKIEKLASQPAYDKRSISTLEPIEKSESATQDISKAQVLEKMLELQMSGKGVRSNHISEFEATGNISDPSVKNMVMNSFKQ